MTDQLDSTTRFEILARLYHRRYGRLAPGKDEPSEARRDSCDDENRDQWTEWLGVHAWSDLLAEINRLEKSRDNLKSEFEALVYGEGDPKE